MRKGFNQELTTSSRKTCPACDAGLVRNGKDRNGYQRLLCKVCRYTVTDTPEFRKPGPKPELGRPMTAAERKRKQRDREKTEQLAELIEGFNRSLEEIAQQKSKPVLKSKR